jgi:hypothetical protein
MMHSKTKSLRGRTSMNMQKQSGAALLISIVVMLALTVLALAATNSNQTQAFMVRNAQFRLETFNASATEIDAQVDAINIRSIADGIPQPIRFLIDSVPGTQLNVNNEGLRFEARATDTYMDQTLNNVYRGPCITTNTDLGAGVARLRCDEVLIRTSSELINSGQVRSDQNQVYQYISLVND